MASIWAGLAGGLGAASNLLLQRQQREWEAKLKEQEAANDEARSLRMYEKQRKIDRSMQAGTIEGTPFVGADGGIYGWKRTKDGGFERSRIGEISPEEMALEQQKRDFEIRRGMLDIEGKEARIEKDRAAAEKYSRQGSGGGGSSGGGSKGLTANQRMNAENQAIDESLQSAGVYKGNDGRYYKDVTGRGGKPTKSPVSPLELTELRELARSRFRGELPDTTRNTQQVPYPEGTRLQGPDGVYVVRNGVPVKE